MIDGRTTDDNCIAMKLQNLQKLQKLAGINGIIKEILPSMPRA